MEQKELEKAKIIAPSSMVVCLPEKAKESAIALPDDSDGIASGFSVLVASYVGKECEHVKVNDIVAILPNSKSTGQFEVLDKKYIMVKEEDIGIIFRR